MRSTLTPERAYLYQTNSSPGLLADDEFRSSICLDEGSSLFLIDQSATKVHSMPKAGTFAKTTSTVEIGDSATLEYLQSPVILFADADFSQEMEITLHPEGALSLGEIMMPGRLARGEIYEFRRYHRHIRVKSPSGQVLLNEETVLTGKGGQLLQSTLIPSVPVWGTLILILPESISTPHNIATLRHGIETLAEGFQTSGLHLLRSMLPNNRGMLLRAKSPNTRQIQTCFKEMLNCVRHLRNQSLLPYSL